MCGPSTPGSARRTRSPVKAPRSPAKTLAKSPGASDAALRRRSARGAAQEKAPSASWDHATALWFLAHAVSSVGLTLANKQLAVSFPRPYSVILCQNAGSAVLTLLLAAMGCTTVTLCTPKQLAQATVSSALLVGVCWTNLAGMRYISVPMYVVGRNVVPVLTAWGETLWLGAGFGAAEIAPLGISVLGSVLYASGDATWEVRGVHLAIGNAFFVTFSSLAEKWLVGKRHNSPVEHNLYRCICSLPMLLVLVVMYEEEPLALPGQLDLYVLLGTCFLAFGIGITCFQLQARVHATSIATANVAYKLISTVASLVLFPVAVSLRGWAGYALSFLGFGLYMVSSRRKKPVATTPSQRAAKVKGA